MDREIKIGCIYTHANGRKYIVLGTVKDVTTNEDLVVYKDVGNHARVWVRPLSKFMMPVNSKHHPKTKQRYRFELQTKIEFVDDQTVVDEIKSQIKENNGYCPCSLVKNRNTKCMCKEFRNMEIGECHCGLYRKVPVTI